jgi:hypothetical protein
LFVDVLIEAFMTVNDWPLLFESTQGWKFCAPEMPLWLDAQIAFGPVKIAAPPCGLVLVWAFILAAQKAMAQARITSRACPLCLRKESMGSPSANFMAVPSM